MAILGEIAVLKDALMDAAKSSLLVIDVQEKLVPVMDAPDLVLANVGRLLKGAELLDVPVLVSEQYPKGLGPTVAPILEAAPAGACVEKSSFSCMADDGYAARREALDRSQAIVCGIEAHVCVTQTSLDLIGQGVEVFVVADATSSRTRDNHSAGLERIRHGGGTVVTTEMVLFEWLRRAGTPEFKAISQLVK